MAEYKGVTHTIVEMLARTQIQAVPRKKDTPRTELPEVGRPKDDRFGEVPTRQQEIQKKIIDEDEASPSAEPGQIAGPAPEKEKKPKKLEIEDIGKQKPTQVVINPELDNTPNIFASTEVKGKPLSEDEADRIKKEVAKAQEMQKARKEAEHIAKHVSGLKSFGGFKVTGSLTPEHIRQGAEIRARMNRLKESRDDYNSASIQYQTRAGNWITARKTSNQPSDIMLAMRTVQKAYSSNRVRAIGAKGFVLDFQPIDPSSIATEDIQEGGSGVGAAAAKAVISGIAVKAALGAVQNNYPTAYGIAQKLKKGWDELPPTPGYTTFARQAPSGNILSAADTVGKYNPGLYKKWKQAQDDSAAKNKVSETVDRIVNEILTYKNSASLRGRDAVAQRDAAIAQAQAQQAQAQQQQQQPPQQNQKKKQQPVQEAKDTRHTGIEVEEPKFNQSIQRVAAHTKWNADAVHTYKHADGSKTRVDQELGTKIHDKINSTPNRHKSKLVQYIHRSADNLKHVLEKE